MNVSAERPTELNSFDIILELIASQKAILPSIAHL